jgi:soluble lytic murein transglycosylase-like protein
MPGFGVKVLRTAALCALLCAGILSHAGKARAEAVAAVTDKPLDAPAMEVPPGNAGMLAPGRNASQAEIIAMIDAAAKRAGMPAEIAEAVAHTESRFNPNAIGADGEIGLMQVLPSTARMLGYSGNLADFAVPQTNIQYGVAYLAEAWRRAAGDLCTTVMKYRAGHGETRFSYLSVDYCRKVRARMASRGFAVAGTLPVATFGNPGGGGGGGIIGCGRKCLASSGNGANLAALNTRLNEIVFRVTVVKVPRP